VASIFNPPLLSCSGAPALPRTLFGKRTLGRAGALQILVHVSMGIDSFGMVATAWAWFGVDHELGEPLISGVVSVPED